MIEALLMGGGAMGATIEKVQTVIYSVSGGVETIPIDNFDIENTAFYVDTFYGGGGSSAVTPEVTGLSGSGVTINSTHGGSIRITAVEYSGIVKVHNFIISAMASTERVQWATDAVNENIIPILSYHASRATNPSYGYRMFSGLTTMGGYTPTGGTYSQYLLFERSAAVGYSGGLISVVELEP